MDDRDVTSPPDLDDPRTPAERAAAAESPVSPLVADGIDLSSLSIAGVTRRRVGWVAAGLVSVWIVVIFARQAGDAATAANRADQIARENAALAAEVAALEGQLKVVQRPEYIAQQARNYDLGGSREVPFTLDPSVPAPGPDAPGSASSRVGVRDERVSPLESWLSILFGPTD